MQLKRSLHREVPCYGRLNGSVVTRAPSALFTNVACLVPLAMHFRQARRKCWLSGPTTEVAATFGDAGFCQVETIVDAAVAIIACYPP